MSTVLLTDAVDGTTSETYIINPLASKDDHVILFELGGTVTNGSIEVYGGVDGSFAMGLLVDHTITPEEIANGAGIIIISGAAISKVSVKITALTGTAPTVSALYQNS